MSKIRHQAIGLQRRNITGESGFRLPVLLSLSLMVMACGVGHESSDVTRETLVSGVERTTWHRLPETRLNLDTLAVWHLWSSESEYVFNNIQAAVGGPDGFYLLDAGNRQIVLVDRQGHFRQAFGRQGSGPGEFEYPRFLCIRNDEIWTGDLVLRRYSIFGMDGSFRRIHLWPGGGRGISGGFAITPDDGELYATYSRDGHRRLLLSPLDGSPMDTIAVMLTRPNANTEINIPGVGRTTMMEPPAYTPEFHWCWGGVDRIITVSSGDYQIEERSISGRITRKLVAPTPDLVVTATDRKAYLTHMARVYGSDTEAFRSINPRFENEYPFAERRPAIEGIRIDPLGRIWVLASIAGNMGQRLDIFTPEFDFLGSLENLPLPMAFTPGGDVLFRITSGEEDGADPFIVARVSGRVISE